MSIQAPSLAKPLLKKAREVLVTCSQNNTKDKAKTAAEVVKLIKSQPKGNNLITRAKKLLSNAFALTFKSVKAKKA
jgi:hypothetical protein